MSGSESRNGSLGGAGWRLSLGFYGARKKDVTDVDQIVGDHAESNKPTHAIDAFVAAAIDSMAALEDAVW
jgi:hypothetical protein